ncbi:MAG: bifunctional phosphoglucose/phosphomannose isomerase [candidate division WOR-3 bacterium]|nr:MAG: bifunctional phosphoglucose/phosphomannose isomerase [candidate division WOR-3 bacterium]
MMRDIIYSLPEQISSTVYSMPDQSFGKKRYRNVLLCGMGGSGISGEIAAVLYPEVPVIVNKDYVVPRFVNRETLAILVSYSGNTEETLANYGQLARRGVDMVLISSDGKLYKKKSLHKIRVPRGLPPRGALGYLFAPLPILLRQARLIRGDSRGELLRLASFLTNQRDRIERTAKTVASALAEKFIVIYADSSLFAPVANRWRCQLNENSKVLVHFNVLPEMNHNEIVGLGRPEKLNADTSVVFICDPRAHPRNKIRRRLLKSLLSRGLLAIMEFTPAGRSNMQSVFWTIMLGDFISYYLAVHTGIDPMPVVRIEELKKKLASYK